MNIPRFPGVSLNLPLSPSGNEASNDPDSSPRIQILEVFNGVSGPIVPPLSVATPESQNEDGEEFIPTIPLISISPASPSSSLNSSAISLASPLSPSSGNPNRPRLTLNLATSATASPSSHDQSQQDSPTSRHRRSATDLPSKPKLSLRPLVCPDPDSPSRIVPSQDHSNSAASKASKLAYFAQQCTQLEDWLYVAGKNIASSRDTLDAHGITHVVNVAGDVCENYFANQGIEYLKFHLLDSAQEDIICVLYTVFEFIESARVKGKKVLVHCQQGVSRSTIICIAYLMFLKDKDYDEAYQIVRQKRGICRPNVGFMCQLLAWRKRATGASARPFCLYRLAPHCSRDRGILAKWVDRVDSSSLDERAVFILHTPACMYIWIGCQLSDSEAESMLPLAHQHIARLQKHEHAPETVFILKQREDRELIPAPLPGQEVPAGIGNLTDSPAHSQPHSPRSDSQSHPSTSGMDSGGDDSPRPIEGPGPDDPPSLHFWYIVGGSPHHTLINRSYDEDYPPGWTQPTRAAVHTRSESANSIRASLLSPGFREPLRSPLPALSFRNTDNPSRASPDSQKPVQMDTLGNNDSIDASFTSPHADPASNRDNDDSMQDDDVDEDEKRDRFPLFSPSRSSLNRTGASESLPPACLYSYTANGNPEFDLLDSFDSDDLFAESLYILVFPTLTLEDGPAVEVHFWIGENAAFTDKNNPYESELEAAARLWMKFLESNVRPDLKTVTPMLLLQKQGEETERFWEGFVDG